MIKKIFFTFLILFESRSYSQYCTPIVSGPQPVTDSIGLTYFGLGNISNNSASKAGYQDFTLLNTTLKKGKEYGFYTGFAVFSQQQIAAWIDYDQNQVFNNAEELLANRGIFPFFFSPVKFTVPITAATGATRFRIASNDSIDIPIRAGICQDILRGDVEDYSVIIADTQYVNSIQPFWTSVAKNETDRVIFGAELIFTDPSLSAVNRTANVFNFTTNGSTSASGDILSAKLWYTDTIDQFYCHPNPVLLGTINNPNGNLNFNINQVLFAAKKNYFWLTYDIASGGTLTNSIDATFEQVTVGGNNYLPDSIAPLAYRKIGKRVSYPHNEANIWYTKTGVGIDFNWEDPAFISDSNKDFACSLSEGVNNTCDQNGDLLFYIDACTIYDRCHNPMPNGQNTIGSGDSYTQGLTIPKPGSNSIYYVFLYKTAELVNHSSLYYSVVDMSLNGGKGDVVAGQKGIFLLDSTLQETVGAVNHCNGKDIWVVTGRYNFNEYDAFLITSSGLQTVPVKSTPAGGPIWSTGSFSDRGVLKFSPNGKKMVATMQSSGIAPHLFDFDNSTGIVSNPITLNNTERQAASFSPDNTKLYMGQTLGGEIHQYNLCASDIIASRQLIGQTPSFGCSYMQNAPNGKIYINPGCSSQYLSVIDDPNSSTPTFTGNGFMLEGTTTDCYTFTSAFNESYFNQSVITEDIIGFTSIQSCNDSVYFTDTTRAMAGCPGPRTWYWNFGDNATSNVQNPKHHYASPGTYSVALAIIQGCQTDTIIKTLNIIPATILVTSTNNSICQGDNTVLSASGGNGYTWLPSAGLNNPTSSVVTIHPTTTTTYTLTGTAANGCPDTTTILITVNSIPVADAGNDVTICNGSTALLSSSGGNNYFWTPSPSLSSISINNPVANPNDTTTYYVTVANGPCVDTDSIKVNVLPLPNIDAQGNTTIFTGGSVTLSANGNGTYNWSPSTGLSCDTCANPVASPNETTTYIVTVTDANNCTISDTIVVTVELHCEELFVPTAFSPNNDGINDIHYIKSNCIKTMDFEIFNRWGEKVFESDNISTGWNGKYNNIEMNNDVFNYILKATLLNSEDVIRKGTVILIK